MKTKLDEIERKSSVYSTIKMQYFYLSGVIYYSNGGYLISFSKLKNGL
jgi:hypothetical protein